VFCWDKTLGLWLAGLPKLSSVCIKPGVFEAVAYCIANLRGTPGSNLGGA